MSRRPDRGRRRRPARLRPCRDASDRTPRAIRPGRRARPGRCRVGVNAAGDVSEGGDARGAGGDGKDECQYRNMEQRRGRMNGFHGNSFSVEIRWRPSDAGAWQFSDIIRARRSCAAQGVAEFVMMIPQFERKTPENRGFNRESSHICGTKETRSGPKWPQPRSAYGAFVPQTTCREIAVPGRPRGD